VGLAARAAATDLAILLKYNPPANL